MKNSTTAMLIAMAAASYAAAGIAGGKGGPSAGAGANVGAGGSHMSASGQANTNGRYASEREFGQDRAAERRADQADEHARDVGASGKRKGPKAVVAPPAPTPTSGLESGGKAN